MPYTTITTKYLGPSNMRGSRVKATCQAGSVTIGYPSELNMGKAHAKVARQLAEKFGWSGVWVQGSTIDGKGYHFVVLTMNLAGTLPALDPRDVAFVIDKKWGAKP